MEGKVTAMVEAAAEADIVAAVAAAEEDMQAVLALGAKAEQAAAQQQEAQGNQLIALNYLRQMILFQL